MAENMPMQPSSDSAERAVLGCIFLDTSYFNRAAEKLRAEDFYFPANRKVYEAMQVLAARAEPIDFQTMEEQLKAEKNYEAIGGIDYLLSLSGGVFYPSNLDSYIKIIKEKAMLRQMIRLGGDMLRRSMDPSEVPAAILEAAEAGLLEINENRNKGGLMRISKSLPETLDKISALSLSKGSLTGLTTGFRDLDAVLSGFQKSDLLLLAARPSMGKTALGVNMGFNVARARNENGEYANRVAVFSLEMSRHQLIQRLLSMASGIPLGKIISGDIDDWNQLLTGIELLDKLPIYIDDTSSISIQELRSKCRRMKLEHGLDFIVIDYLQLMTVDDIRRNENRQQEISTISRGLKGLAKEMDCPVLALSQLSRKAESREGARPQMSDMRESGAIEQDADVVMLLYREDYYNKETEKPNITEVIIAKHRNGETKTVELYFVKEQTRFTDITYRDEPGH